MKTELALTYPDLRMRGVCAAFGHDGAHTREKATRTRTTNALNMIYRLNGLPELGMALAHKCFENIKAAPRVQLLIRVLQHTQIVGENTSLQPCPPRRFAGTIGRACQACQRCG